MNWSRIALGLTVPLVLAVLVALPLWFKGNVTIGNLLGTGIIFGIAITLIGREYVELESANGRMIHLADSSATESS